VLRASAIAVTSATQIGQNWPCPPLVSQITVQIANSAAAAGLLQDPTLQLAAPLRQLRLALGRADRERRQVLHQLGQVGVGASLQRGLQTLVELVLGQPARGVVLANRLSRLLTLLI
jgi:hypothetical protein